MEKNFVPEHEALRKDVERAFGVILSSWHIVKQPCLFCDPSIMAKVMKVAIILHNMIVEHYRDGYGSGLFQEAEKAVEHGSFIDENDEAKPFHWQSRNAQNEVRAVVLTDTEWARQLADWQEFVMDEI